MTGLVHRYPSGVLAVDGVSLAVPAGSRIAILGANGAGKTTLVRHWNGLLRPSQGSLRVDGQDAQARPTSWLASRVGYVFQNPDDQLFGRKVEDEVGLGPTLCGVRGAERLAAVCDALNALDLDGVRHRHPFDLDYTERKMVALACVLAMRTPVLVLDEPTVNLDRPAVERITRALRDLGADRTVVAVTHDLDWAAENFTRFIVMQDGKVLVDGPAEVVLTRIWPHVEIPSIPYLAAALHMPARVTRLESFLSQIRGTSNV